MRSPAVTRKFAALSLLVILAATGCSQPAAGDRSTGSSATAVPTTGVTSASASTAPTVVAAFDAALAAKLQASVEDSVTKLHYPALAAAVILPDGGSWSGAAGKSDVEANVSATPGTSFAIASITKTFMAALVLELAREGVLSLDDPIAKWLPQLADDARFAADQVTVRQLLNHTSGIGEYTDSHGFGIAVSNDAAHHWTSSELLELVGDPGFAPGTDWAYSNTNYILAGMILERASGSTVASLLRDRILTPLALSDTALQPKEQPAGPTAHGYAASIPGGSLAKPVDPWDGSGLIPNAFWASAASTAGAIASTASDLARWAAALFGGRVLDAASLAEMLDLKRTAGLPGLQGRPEYGLGVAEMFGHAGLTVGHAGAIPGFQSGMWYFTKSRATVAILANTDAVSLDAAHLSLETTVLAYLGR